MYVQPYIRARKHRGTDWKGPPRGLSGRALAGDAEAELGGVGACECDVEELFEPVGVARDFVGVGEL